MKALEVKALCEKYGPQYSFDPLFVMAIVQQESSYDESAARPEPNFYLKYTRPFRYATTTELLLANSYGLAQLMGESLREAGFFVWWFSQQHELLGDLMGELAVPKALNQYMVHPEWQIEWGCKWLVKKREKARGDMWKTLLYWNGSRDYPDKVLTRYESLKKQYAR